MYNRVFTFGCSFVRHAWPTWADIIIWDLNLPGENWGLTGIGNQAIFTRMMDCHLKNNITEKDLVLVMWSGWDREDRIMNGVWRTGGSVFHSSFYDEQFVKNYWSPSHDIIKNATAIISANKIFNIKFNGAWSDKKIHRGENSIFEYRHANLSDPLEKKIMQFYSQHLPTTHVFHYDCDRQFNILVKDKHPDIMQHLNFVQDVVYKQLGFVLKQKTIDMCETLNKFLFKKASEQKNFIENFNITTEVKFLLEKFDISFRTDYGVY